MKTGQETALCTYAQLFIWLSTENEGIEYY
jgi:hypothetical protein